MSEDVSRPSAQRRWLWRSPERSRLDGAISEAEIALGSDDEPVEEWRRGARQHLKKARDYLNGHDFQQGWISLQTAQRKMLLNSKGNELMLAAIELRREADKISGWRAKAITDLICDANGKLRPGIDKDPDRMRVINALSLRDDQFQTSYFKIQLRRRHLFRLFILLLAGIAATLFMSACEILPEPFNNPGLMAGVVLFGVLGAALSVARGLLVADISAKIPAQQIGAFVIWMRPAIGAAAALISFVLLNAKAFSILDWDPKSPTVIFTVAIAAGFSERFIVGAIERIGDGSDKSAADKKKSRVDDKDKKPREEGDQA